MQHNLNLNDRKKDKRLWQHTEAGAGVFCGDSRAHSVDGNSALNDSSPYTEYPILASLESDIAQELSLSLNGALWEKLVEYTFETLPMLIMHALWVTLLGLWRRRTQMLYQPALHLSPGSTPSKQNPIAQASLERLNTCFYFLFLQSISPHSLPLSCLLFVLQCKEDEAMGMRRAPLLLYFLSTEMLFTRKISS